ncbi:hypothetical protein HHK36_006316 [Tetracentron sinense]|uniref:protein-serine/threonine phosphatase n=1 Tax=Tetracentron sinense TaxID=13715 RepID=A0A834ZH16_TETSI|nr:hypothetical protein HHK36_006316 [Tetracentron sinense]
MCVKDAEKDGEEMEDLGLGKEEKPWSLHSGILNTQIENWEKDFPKNTADGICLGNDSAVSNSSPLESICENTVVIDSKQNQLINFVPAIRSGEWSDIGGRDHMEDTHVCIADLAKKFGCNFLDGEAISFFGVFDGHGGKSAAHFVRDNLPRVIVEDADFPLELEKVVVRSLLVANAGDCRAVLSRLGEAVEMSKDHKPCCAKEKKRIESLGGYIDDGYLNGELGVTRALGDWHIGGMKEIDKRGGPLSAEPELKLITLTKEEEFLIIGSDGLWDMFTSQNAIEFARRKLQEHNDVKLCCMEMVAEAIKRGARDNLTIVMVCFQSDPPPHVVVQRGRVRRSISAEGLHSLKCLLEG